MSSPTASPRPAAAATRAAPDGASGRAGEHRPGGVPRGGGGVGGAAAREHHLGLRAARPARSARRAAPGSRAGAGRGRRRPRWSRSARTRGTRRRSRARWTRARRGGARSTSAAARRSCSGWRKPQSRHTAADSNSSPSRRSASACLVELAEHSVRAGALGHGHPQVGRHERRGMGGAEPVELGARLAAQLLDVGEPLGGEQRGARHAPLEQRVRGHGHPVHEALDVPGPGAGPLERLGHRAQHALGLVVRRGGRLRRDERVRR